MSLSTQKFIKILREYGWTEAQKQKSGSHKIFIHTSGRKRSFTHGHKTQKLSAPSHIKELCTAFDIPYDAVLGDHQLAITKVANQGPPSEEGTLGRFLFDQRQEMRVSQGAVARAVKIGQGTLSAYERNATIPSNGVLNKLRKYYGFTEEEMALRVIKSASQDISVAVDSGRMDVAETAVIERGRAVIDDSKGVLVVEPEVKDFSDKEIRDELVKVLGSEIAREDSANPEFFLDNPLDNTTSSNEEFSDDSRGSGSAATLGPIVSQTEAQEPQQASQAQPARVGPVPRLGEAGGASESERALSQASIVATYIYDLTDENNRLRQWIEIFGVRKYSDEQIEKWKKQAELWQTFKSLAQSEDDT